MERIYLVSQRKQWHHDLPDGWKEIAWERFTYVECGVYEKPTHELTEEDKMLVESYGERPDGWIEP